MHTTEKIKKIRLKMIMTQTEFVNYLGMAFVSANKNENSK